LEKLGSPPASLENAEIAEEESRFEAENPPAQSPRMCSSQSSMFAE
jgi:hypothetical protein